jgi:hypothetical protein
MASDRICIEAQEGKRWKMGKWENIEDQKKKGDKMKQQI